MRVTARVFYGEYTEKFLPENRREIESTWSRERWILEKDDEWISGPYFRRGSNVYLVRDRTMKIGLPAKSVKHWLYMLGEKPVYYDGSNIRDAITGVVLFAANYFRICDAGFAVKVGEKLHFTDGVRKDLPLGKIVYPECVRFLRVSETEYSIQVGRLESGYRYFLLDTAKWTYHRVYFFCFGRMVRVARRQSL